MRSNICRVGMVLAGVGMVFIAKSGVSAQVSDEVKQKIAKAYAALDKSYSKKDTKAIFEVITPDYTDKSHGKVENAEQWKKNVTETIAFMNTISAKTRIVKIKGDSKKIVAEVQVTVDAVTKPDPTGKTHKYHADVTESDTWVDVKGEWKFKMSETTKQVETVDGKKSP